MTRGPIGGFGLTVTPDPVALGGRVTVRLENGSPERRMTGVKRKYLVERRTAEGWESIFSRDPARTAVYNDAGVLHDPGEGFTWDRTVTPRGLDDGWYHVCDPLTAGAYRFVYFGIPGPPVLAAPFDVTRS